MNWMKNVTLNPMNTSAIYALIHTIEKDGGVWFARGGTNRLVAGLVALFERLGGVLRPSAIEFWEA